MERLGSLARRYLFDAAIVLGSAGAVLELVLSDDRVDAPTTSWWFAVPAVAAIPLPLLLRRRYPFAAPVTSLLLCVALSFVDGALVPFVFATFLTVLAVAFLFGMRPDVRQGVGGLAILLAAALIVIHNDPDRVLGDYLFTPLVCAVVWLAGVALGRKLAETRELHERALLAERRRDEEAREAVLEERRRIARELHDVVAHSVSVMTVQAGGVRRLLEPDHEREREALLAIEDTGRTALAEMRRLLGMLRGANEMPLLAPQPGMGTLGALVEQVRDAGLPVEYRVEGEPVDLPPGIDLSAYRIVQEALTNALKHAGPARARVSVRYRPTRLELEIENDGAGDGNGDREGSGQGLVGMQQRVELYGGRLAVGPRVGAPGYRVQATLPLTEDGSA